MEMSRYFDTLELENGSKIYSRPKISHSIPKQEYRILRITLPESTATETSHPCCPSFLILWPPKPLHHWTENPIPSRIVSWRYRHNVSPGRPPHHLCAPAGHSHPPSHVLRYHTEYRSNGDFNTYQAHYNTVASKWISFHQTASDHSPEPASCCFFASSTPFIFPQPPRHAPTPPNRNVRGHSLPRN